MHAYLHRHAAQAVVLTLWLSLLVACAPQDTALPEQTREPARTTSTTVRRTTTTRPTATVPPGPIVSVTCPRNETTDGSSYMAYFDGDVDWDQSGFALAKMDYGDGKSYTSPTLEDANKNLLWHRYKETGSFDVRFTVTDLAGHSGTDTCRFVWLNPTVTTRPAPPAPRVTAVAPQGFASSCDPNYTGCVPIDSDVDCAGGSGNGPSYVWGPVRVIGRDIYRLDGDNDGIGCE